MADRPTENRRLWSRRTFLARASGVAVVAFAGFTGAHRTAQYARAISHRPQHVDIDVITCVPLDCWGCACGGDFYHCTGSGTCGNVDFKKCYTGHNCQTWQTLPC